MLAQKLEVHGLRDAGIAAGLNDARMISSNRVRGHRQNGEVAEICLHSFALGDVSGHYQVGISLAVDERVRYHLNGGETSIFLRRVQTPQSCDEKLEAATFLRRCRHFFDRAEVFDNQSQKLFARIDIVSHGGVVQLKHTEQALHLSKERYRLLFESNPHPAGSTILRV